MKYRYFFILLWALVLFASAPGCADTLVLANKESLSGTLLKITDGLVFFDSAVAGKLIVLAEEVSSLVTDADWNVKLKNGDVLTGNFVRAANAIGIRSGDEAQAVPVDLVAVESASRLKDGPKKPASHTPADELPAIETELALGQYWRHGTNDYSGPFAKLRILTQEERYRFFSDSLLEITSDDDFPRLFSVVAEWQFFPERTTRPQLSLSLQRDTANALDFRASLGAGVWQSLYEDELQELDFSADLTADFEYYDASSIETGTGLLSLAKAMFLSRILQENFIDHDNALHRDLRRFTKASYYADEKEQQHDLGLRAELDYRRELPWKSRFTQEVTFMPGLTDWGDLRAESLSAWQVPIAPNLKLKLELEVTYEETPKGLGVDDWRSALGASVTWDF